MRDALMGEIAPFPTPTLPDGWLPCDGRLITIRDNPALFAIIGTMYGGNGETTFALPNLSGRAPIGAAWDYKVGQTVETPATGTKVEKEKVAAAVYAIGVRGIFPSRE